MIDIINGLLPDWRIKQLCRDDIHQLKMIEPFVDKQVKEVERSYLNGYSVEKVISYGLSSYGYDIRVGTSFKIFTNVFNGATVIDPKNFSEDSFHTVDTEDFCVIPPNSFALAVSLEKFAIPRNVLTVCLGKSTYARCGIIVNVTPFEPEWRGHATLEISNTSPLPARIYANEGIAQVLFFAAVDVCEKSYADKAGKYQDQANHVVLPKV